MTAPQVFSWMVDQSTKKHATRKPATKTHRPGAGRPFGFHQAVYDAMTRGLSEGRSMTSIADECGVHINTVKNHARRIKAGKPLTVTREPFSARHVAEVKRLVASGLTAKAAGKVLGLSDGSVHGIIRHRLGTTVEELRANGAL